MTVLSNVHHSLTELCHFLNLKNKFFLHCPPTKQVSHLLVLLWQHPATHYKFFYFYELHKRAKTIEAEFLFYSIRLLKSRCHLHPEGRKERKCKEDTCSLKISGLDMTHISFAHITLERENVVYTYCKGGWETVYPHTNYYPMKMEEDLAESKPSLPPSVRALILMY